MWNEGGFWKYFMSGTISMIMMLGLLYPTGLVHELGHSIVCWYSGGSVFIPWIFTKLMTLCDPFPEHIKEISWAMGGSFGIIASISPLFAFKFLRKWDFIIIGFIGCGFMQLGFAIFESMINELYKINDPVVLLPIVLLGVLNVAVFTWSIDKIREHCTRKNP
ncbi:MAG: hypothetical protein COY74_03560 [Nitrosopumilales archaeon CG_4_10_14_0_8_um_filter_34_8]|nr:MAG: hypothetical protein COY74_03560 [Nitrosopumilales archaeon CG_4_10_14_0_8_um_filter_34_8]